MILWIMRSKAKLRRVQFHDMFTMVRSHEIVKVSDMAKNMVVPGPTW